MTLYRANFDYESELFWTKRDNWAVEMLEHLLFYCIDKKDTLYSSKSYSLDYLAFLKDALGFTPRMSSIGEPENWWGKLENIKIEKVLNSKVTSFDLANELNLNHSKSRLVTSIDELQDFLKTEKDIFLRHPYERAGRVSFRLNSIESFEKQKDKIEKVLETQPLLGDLYFESRRWDLGSCLIQNGGKFEVGFQIKNLNDSLGVFRGAVLLDEIIESVELEKIGKAYYKLGARELIQIDSFAYDGGINWLCEANYRKTMGYVVSKLKRMVPPEESVAFLMTPKSWLKEYITHKQLVKVLEDLEGVFPLSPVENPIYCWLISAEGRENLLAKAKELWALVAKDGQEFPGVYEKILPDKKTPEIKLPI